MDGIVGVVLAAGRGTRLRPLTRLRPKALCPVGNVPLVDLALERVRPAVDAVAVNLHHGRRTLDLHLADDVHRSIEADAAPRHGRRARPPPVVDRRPGRARRQRRRLVPRLAGALRGRLGRRADPAAGPRRRRAAARQRHRRRADAVVRRRDARGRSPRASTRRRGAAAAGGGPHRGRAPRRSVRRLRHAAGSTWRPTCWRAAVRAWWSRARWSRASSTAAWCGATPASTPGESLSCCIRARGRVTVLAVTRQSAGRSATRGLVRRPELAAGGVDLGAAGAADRRVHAAGAQLVAELAHPLGR